jgi:hypothetical protein
VFYDNAVENKLLLGSGLMAQSFICLLSPCTGSYLSKYVSFVHLQCCIVNCMCFDFPYNLELLCQYPQNNLIRFYFWYYIKSVDQVVKGIMTILILVIHECRIAFPLFRLFLISFIRVLLLSMSTFIRLISKYFTLVIS